jgi:hypothetical protein
MELHHVRNLYRTIHDNKIVIKDGEKKLKGREAIFAAQKAKRLPLCCQHHKDIHNNKLDIKNLKKEYFLNN